MNYNNKNKKGNIEERIIESVIIAARNNLSPLKERRDYGKVTCSKCKKKFYAMDCWSSLDGINWIEQTSSFTKCPYCGARNKIAYKSNSNVTKHITDGLEPRNFIRDKVSIDNNINLAGEHDRIAVIKRCPKKKLTDDRPESEQQWCLYDSKGERLLGRHPTKEKALDQERVIQIHKHVR